MFAAVLRCIAESNLPLMDVQLRDFKGSKLTGRTLLYEVWV